MKISSIKTDEEGFNNLEIRNSMLRILQEHNIRDAFIPVDINENFGWQNDRATLVLGASAEMKIEWGLRIAKVSRILEADEFSFIQVEHDDRRYVVVKMWWD